MEPFLKEIAGLEKDWTRPVSGNILLPQHDRLLVEKGNRDLSLYETTLRDDQVYASLQQRFALQTCLEWTIEPGGDSQADLAAFEFVSKMVERLDFDRLTQEMLYAIFYGFSVAELMLIEDQGLINLDYEKKGIRVRNRRRFWFDKENNVRLRTIDNPEGEILDPSRIWLITVGGTHSDDPYGCGLAYWLYWLAFFKRGVLKLWLQNLEAEATRRPVAKYPQNATESEKNEALSVAEAIADGKPFAVSENTTVQLLGTIAQGGSFDLLWEACNQSISKIVLSQTMTLDDGSSLAQAEVHKDVLDAIVKSDADIIAQTFNNQVIRRLCQWNFENANPPKLYRTATKNFDRKLEAEIDKLLIANGWQPTQQRILTVFGDQYEKIPDAKPQSNVAQEFSSPSSTPPVIRSGGIYEFAEAQQDAIDLFTARAIQKTRPILKEWISKLKKHLQSSESLEEFAETLPELYDSLDSEEFEDILAQALEASKLAGYFESERRN